MLNLDQWDLDYSAQSDLQLDLPLVDGDYKQMLRILKKSLFDERERISIKLVSIRKKILKLEGYLEDEENLEISKELERSRKDLFSFIEIESEILDLLRKYSL